MKRERWMAGYYRISNGRLFAGIKHERDGWYVEIRYSATGDMKRYAGIWDTLRDATEEAEHVLAREA